MNEYLLVANSSLIPNSFALFNVFGEASLGSSFTFVLDFFDAIVFHQECQASPDLFRAVKGLKFTGAEGTFGQVCSHHVKIHIAQAGCKVIGGTNHIVQVCAYDARGKTF